jgi:co-chaperonin GroES (HSP10)
VALAKLIHTEDPREAILRALGNALDGFDIAAQGVLVATYVRPDDIKTEGGILVPHEAVKDDQYQSKVGLVVMLGRRAFEDDEHVQWHGYRCGIGDWVVFKASDGAKMDINGVHCRLISDVHLRMKVPTQDAVF